MTAHEEFDSPQTIEAIAQVLRGRGHEVVLLGDGREFVEKALAEKPDFVFNFAEGHGREPSREARVPAALELLGIPYTAPIPSPWPSPSTRTARRSSSRPPACRCRSGTLWSRNQIWATSRRSGCASAGREAGLGGIEQGHSQQVPRQVRPGNCPRSSTPCAAIIADDPARGYIAATS